ncbi:MAG: hypothetical protein GXO91_11175 [FCB group bacterium]|nr:hypothetical protein [FCB group bacterium]
MDGQVIEVANSLLNLKLNANEGEGKELSRRYKIEGVPQMVFVTNDGTEVDRIVGFLPPDQYKSRLEDILAGKNTIPDLLARFEKTPDDLELAVQLAGKYEDRGDYDSAAGMYASILQSHADSSSEEVNHARYFLAMKDLFAGDRSGIDRFILKYGFSKYVYDAYREMAQYYAAQNDTLQEVAALEAMSQKYPDDPSALNAFAWRMTELNMNLETALQRAAHAVELTRDDATLQANILDTQAEVFWKLGRADEAVQTIEKALKIDPESSYFQGQKSKFLGAES